MLKKIIIMLLFLIVFGAAAFLGYSLITPSDKAEPAVQMSSVAKPQAGDTAEVHTYSSDDLRLACSSQDKVFCAIERTVKCIIEPTLDICDKEFVPNFVIGQTDDVERPTEISFKVTKIKPAADRPDISVYTESTCNAVWFGLCQGTVVYSLILQGDDWKVKNMYALE